jgi:hypothetical protein
MCVFYLAARAVTNAAVPIRVLSLTPSPIHRAVLQRPIATARHAMTSCDHADAAFATDPEALPSSEPSLSLVGTPRRRCPRPRQKSQRPRHWREGVGHASIHDAAPAMADAREPFEAPSIVGLPGVQAAQVSARVVPDPERLKPLL